MIKEKVVSIGGSMLITILISVSLLNKWKPIVLVVFID